MSEISGEVSGGIGSNPAGHASDGSDDVPVDVCISHPQGAGRFQLQFLTSKPLVETLIAWKAQGHADIWLTWGNTSLAAREHVERALALASVRYESPAAASAEPPPTRAALLVTALGGVIAFAALVYFLTQKANDVGEGLNKAAEEQRERDEQNRKMIGRTLDDLRTRAFRELEDADPAVRLQAVAQVGQLYSSDAQAVPALVKRVRDDDRKVRIAAILVLGDTRMKSEAAADALRACLADEDEQVRKAARDALAK